MKRVFLEVLVSSILLGLYGFGVYEKLTPPLQLVGEKWLLVSMGFLAAHIGRKIMFPYVDLNKPVVSWVGGTYVAMAFYVVIPLCFALGG